MESDLTLLRGTIRDGVMDNRMAQFDTITRFFFHVKSLKQANTRLHQHPSTGLTRSL
ncbi:MAG: hypothetical protein NW220_08925 [Leptolyngbyaceae cyanobacterium bins.349]|nr:hypothetical protein [Leptolyngbyaceae cyanobacterium bins.349]